MSLQEVTKIFKWAAGYKHPSVSQSDCVLIKQYFNFGIFILHVFLLLFGLVYHFCLNHLSRAAGLQTNSLSNVRYLKPEGKYSF